MSSKRKRNQPASPPPPAAGKWRRPHAKPLLAATAILAFTGLVWWSARPPKSQPPAPAAPAASPTIPASNPAASPADFLKLKGRWRRPDGGYVIEVKSVDGGGVMDAAYFNPRPIHVARAAASREGAETRVAIELRDVNYPGSTYNLAYNPQRDRLQGIYYQAALKQSYEVLFARVK